MHVDERNHPENPKDKGEIALPFTEHRISLSLQRKLVNCC